MNKRIIVLMISLMVMLVVALGVTSCNLVDECEHDWAPATCTEPKTCKLCQATEGTPLTHTGGKATCKGKAVCVLCQQPYGELADHVWVEATCTDAAYCSVCDMENGYKLGHYSEVIKSCNEYTKCDRCNKNYIPGHIMGEATCTAPSTCTRVGCGHTVGDPLGHNMKNPTCTEPATCSRCDHTEGNPLGHDWADATCTTPKTCNVCRATEGAALGHDWADATCTAPKTCNTCHATEGEALNHFCVDVSSVAPTCTEDGYVVRECVRCDFVRVDYGMDNNTKLGHELVSHPYKYATCTEDGHNAYVECTRDDCGYTTFKAIPAYGHNMLPATCTLPSTCSRYGCGHTEGDALGHTAGDAATCISDQICTVCNTVLVPKFGHVWSAWTPNDDGTTHTRVCSNNTCDDCVENADCNGPTATCTTDQVCNACARVMNVATGHTPGDAPTCTEDQICLTCGEVLADRLGHALVGATCTEPVKCTREGCDYTEGNALDHVWSAWVSNNNGTHTKTCSNDPTHVITLHCASTETVKCGVDVVCNDCGYVIEEAPDHDYLVVVTDPTCLVGGYTTYTCQREGCGHSYVGDEVDALGHDYLTTVTDPTCLAGGYTTHTCQREDCGHSYVSDEVDALGHNYGEWTVADGTHTRVCQNDQTHVETGKCVSDTTADCENAQICSVCNNVMTPALGHNWSEWEVVKGTHTRVCQNDETHVESGSCHGAPATCEDAQVCEVCSTVMTRALGHRWGDWTSNGNGTHTRICANNVTHTETADCAGVKASCTSPAFCSSCNTNYGTALGHSYDYACDDACNICSAVRASAIHIDDNTDDICDNCNQKMPREPRTPGQKIGIVLLCLATAGGGGFLVYWFVFKKKLIK